ncbi:hypothetical protein FHW16_005440 [Phyllobacterium myrsinacearum]|uniref:Uncharacterized protein n=1 Tax=Phyllobacterium myrsinacearum TaxID=28101 RepID=A0A839EUB2_9HYPH|nr:hypothetical protein [Phyllobacterium myrsinacearum]
MAWVLRKVARYLGSAGNESLGAWASYERLNEMAKGRKL